MKNNPCPMPSHREDIQRGFRAVYWGNPYITVQSIFDKAVPDSARIIIKANSDFFICYLKVSLCFPGRPFHG